MRRRLTTMLLILVLAMGAGGCDPAESGACRSDQDCDPCSRCVARYCDVLEARLNSCGRCGPESLCPGGGPDAGTGDAGTGDAGAGDAHLRDASHDEASIVISGPISLTGRYAHASSQVLAGALATIDWVNEVLGGVLLADGTVRKISLDYTDDASGELDVEATANITRAACENEAVHFLLAPYSSGLTAQALEVANDCGKLLLAHGGAADSLFAPGNMIASSLAPASRYHRSLLDAIEAAAGEAAGTSVGLYHAEGSFIEAVQSGAAAYAEQRGFDVLERMTYSRSDPVTEADLAGVVAAIEERRPDVILGGGYEDDGQLLLRELRGGDATAMELEAISLLVAPLDPDFFHLVQHCPPPCDYVNHPAQGVTGPTQWISGVAYTRAAAMAEEREWVGPTQEEFARLYERYAGVGAIPTYRAASGAVMILSLVRAIVETQSVETAPVQTALRELSFMSLWGNWDIDDTGANVGHEMVLVQWIDGQMQVVWPEAARTASFLYPIP